MSLQPLRRVGSLLLPCLMAALAGIGAVAVSSQQTPPSRVGSAYVQIPLAFEENRGQAPKDVKFLVRGARSTLLIGDTDGTMLLTSGKGSKLRQSAVRWQLEGARRAQATAERPQAGKVNFLRGSDPSRWVTGVPTSAAVRSTGVYAGIDLVYYGNKGSLEYDFVVAPAAEPSDIRLAFEGATPKVDAETGDLVLSTPAGDLRQHRPIAYQANADGSRTPVAADYSLGDESTVTFALGEYDPARTLVIDPVLSYSTFLGGSDGDGGQKIAVDSDGAAYVTGATVSNNFPAATGAFDTSYNFGNDAFVAKIAPDGRSLVYATYLGGGKGGGDDYGMSIALGADNTAYITGPTNSTDFPTTQGAFDRTHNGEFDAFVAHLNADGTGLIGSTFFGGTGFENTEEVFFKLGGAIAVDNLGNATITGKTTSNNLPMRNAAQNTFGGGNTDAFVACISPNATTLIYSTYLGGNADEAMFGADIAIAGGQFLVTGETQSPNFPTTAGAFDTTYGGSSDGYVALLTPGVSGAGGIAYSTFFGASGVDFPAAVAVDDTGDVYLAGSTNSDDFPLLNPFQGIQNADADCFVAKMDLSAAGSAALLFSSFHGGNTSNETAYDIAVDDQHAVYLAGYTDAVDFPTLDPIQGAAGGSGDTWVSKVAPSGSALVYSSYLGGNQNDGLFGNGGVAVDSNRNAYVTGFTQSGNFPVLSSMQPFGGVSDAFVAKICDGGEPPIAPDQLAANAISSGHVRLTWRDRSTDETGFQIERRAGPANGQGAFTLVSSVGPGVTTFTDSGLAPTSQHTYRVRVINACGQATSATVTVTTPAAGRLVVKTKKLEFGTVKVGSSRTKNAKLKNTGAGPVLVTISGLKGTPYTSLPATELIIAPGAKVLLPVTFTPVARGNARATLNLRDADSKAPAARVKLSGKGKVPRGG